MAKGYVPVIPRSRDAIPREYVDFIRRRTVPFIDHGGTRYSLEHLMAEAYLQGMRDVLAVTRP